MKKPDKTGIVRTVRLEKGYKTRLKSLVKNTRFGTIESLANSLGIARGTLSSVLKTGRCNRSNKLQIEAFVDREAPVRTKQTTHVEHSRNIAAAAAGN